MADAKISALPSATAATTDEVPVNQAGVTSKVTAAAISKLSIEDTIVNAVTDKAPSQNAVFDALALKVTGVSSAVDAELVLFDSTTGKLVKRATGSGFVKATSGVYSTVTPASTDISDFNEAAQDTVGGILTDTATIQFTYNDGAGTITADVKSNSVTAAMIADAELAAIGGLTSAADKGIQFTGSGTAATYDLTTAGKALLDDANAAAQVTTLGLDNTKISTISFCIDGGGAAISTGIKVDIVIPFACTINNVTLLADQSGSVVIDLWKDTYANFPPTVADTITAAAKPTISAATKSQDTTLTGWTTSVSAGDIIRVNVDSASTITRLTGVLKVTKT